MSKKQQQRKIRAEKQAAAEAATKRKSVVMRCLIWGVGAILITAALLAVYDSVFAPPPSVSEVVEADRMKGNPDAKLTLVEYSDFQCPACRAQHQAIRKIWAPIKGSVRFVYRHFPLSNIHPHAITAAHYSEAAAKQGKFWELHDMLFDRQGQWSGVKEIKPVFDGYVEELKLDKVQFAKDLASDEIRDKVASDIQSAKQAQAASTPTLFLNGQLLRDVREADKLKAVIRQAIKDAEPAN
ncbi:MAG: DsbA family protein [Leucothrix sp.]